MRKLLCVVMAVTALAAVGAAGASTVTTWAYGGVTLDPFTGIGSVPKGDVQTLLGWNNKQYQAEVGNLVFHLQGSYRWLGQCEYQPYSFNGEPLGERRIIGWGTRLFTSFESLLASPRVNTKQITGIDLTLDPFSGMGFPLVPGANEKGGYCTDIRLLYPDALGYAVWVTEPKFAAEGTLYLGRFGPPIYRYSINP